MGNSKDEIPHPASVRALLESLRKNAETNKKTLYVVKQNESEVLDEILELESKLWKHGMSSHPLEKPFDPGNIDAQVTLANFLMIDIELAFAFLQRARGTRIDIDRQKAIRDARSALIAVRHFEGKLQDPIVWIEIHSRGDKLASALAKF